MPRFPITEAQFKAWRKKHPSNRGLVPGSCSRCLIATAIRQKVPGALFWNDYWWAPKMGTGKVPKWAKEIGERFDAGEAL